ncbi:MAG: hypothetical protein QOI95_3106 [Acidimicrobiaceae bacterium]
MVVYGVGLVLSRVLDELKHETGEQTRLLGYFEVAARWALPDQELGIISLADLQGLVDESALLSLLARAQQQCDD